MLNYPIGQRGESVWFDITTTCYGLIKLLSTFCESEGELNGDYFFTLDAGAHDVVDLVEKAKQFSDGVTSISYSICDTPEQDWAATVIITEGKITEVIEEGVTVE